jgi:hypothetical protein
MLPLRGVAPGDISSQPRQDRVNSHVWDPDSGMVPNGFNFGACFGPSPPVGGGLRRCRPRGVPRSPVSQRLDTL